MSKAPTFENTVGILAKAWLNDTLGKGSCHACAVGNICAAALGTRVTKDLFWEEGRAAWAHVFTTGRFMSTQAIRPGCYTGEAKTQIDATGYTWQQLAKIEFAFETAQSGGYYGHADADEASYAGLMATVDVLANIHGVDLATTEAAKKLFVRA